MYEILVSGVESVDSFVEIDMDTEAGAELGRAWGYTQVFGAADSVQSRSKYYRCSYVSRIT